jgi:hypothetical protein
MRTSLALVLVLMTAGRAAAQQESKLRADFRREATELRSACGRLSGSGLAGCAHALLTLPPLHLALGRIAPANGLAAGAAFAERFTPNESWRLSWNADAVHSVTTGAWRAGLYMKMVHTPATAGVIVAPAGTVAGATEIRPRELTVFDVFVQSTTLARVNFFGIGPDSEESARTVFGARHVIVGGRAVVPLGRGRVLRALRPAFIGGIGGRFISIRSGIDDEAPSIETVFGDDEAPGLARQDGYVEFQEAVRLKPSIAGDRIRLNYLVSAQQFRTSRAAAGSFDRWTLDLHHEIPLVRGVASSGPREFNGPNECTSSPGSSSCPPITWSRNRQGAVHVRVLTIVSSPRGDDRVPFYLQPTIGGSDLNGERLLPSFPDYRFRAPSLFAVQAGVEHSIWGPLGVFVQVERGQVAATRSDLWKTGFRTSSSVGLTIRAGSAPVITLAYAWGGGGHTYVDMASTLFGGSLRPSLY